MTELFSFAVILLQGVTEGTHKAVCCLFCEEVKDSLEILRSHLGTILSDVLWVDPA